MLPIICKEKMDSTSTRNHLKLPVICRECIWITYIVSSDLLDILIPSRVVSSSRSLPLSVLHGDHSIVWRSAPHSKKKLILIHACCTRRFNHYYYMLITRAVPGIDILIEVFLCHRVDKVSARIFFYAYNTATYL